MLSSIAPGSDVAVVAPAGPVAEERYRAGLRILASRYTIVHAFEPGSARPPFPYLADEDAVRAEALNRALRDPAIGAIFCARGGYGAMRLLPLLDGEALRRRRPLLVGFSDVTVLHAWAASLGVPTVHGPVVTQLAELPLGDVQVLFDVVEGRPPSLEGLRTLAPGQAEGPLLGGNLTLLSHLCGTPWQPDLRGRILLLEEIGEVPYRLDRMLTHLRLSGALQGVAGVLVGELTSCRVDEGPPPLEVVAERLLDLGVPIAAAAPVGHGGRNVALPFGVPARLDATGGRLEILDEHARG